MLFFACLGLTADLRRLLRGGPRLLRFLVALVPFLIVQDGLGVLIAKLLGLHPFLGLVAGSITLAGGHGTGAAYVEKFGEASAIPGLVGLTMTSCLVALAGCSSMTRPPTVASIEGLSPSLRVAFVAGSSKAVGGVDTELVVLANRFTQMQIWIGVDDKLPRLLRASMSDQTERSGYVVAFSDWQLDVAIPPDRFATAPMSSANPGASASGCASWYGIPEC